MFRELQEYIGKKITVDLEKLSEDNAELDWEYNPNDDGSSFKGIGHINIDYRPYNLNEDTGQEDEEFDESSNWDVQIGLDFETNSNSYLSSIQITVSIYGDSGLGDCDPDEIWTSEDYKLAKIFLNKITKEQEN